MVSTFANQRVSLLLCDAMPGACLPVCKADHFPGFSSFRAHLPMQTTRLCPRYEFLVASVYYNFSVKNFSLNKVLGPS
jgi:peroxiredoxin